MGGGPGSAHKAYYAATPGTYLLVIAIAVLSVLREARGAALLVASSRAARLPNNRTHPPVHPPTIDVGQACVDSAVRDCRVSSGVLCVVCCVLPSHEIISYNLSRRRSASFRMDGRVSAKHGASVC